MKPGAGKVARWLGLVVGTLLCLAVLASPDEDGICEHVFELAAAAGEDAAAAGIDHQTCTRVMEARRDRMYLLRRAYYGWCVRSAASLDEAGRC